VTKKKYYHLDGIERDIAKLKDEYVVWWTAVRPILWEFITLEGGVSEIGHNFTDLFVEGRRASPYFSGHIGAVVVPVGIVSFCWMVADIL
jgi:hypothetical protein